MSQDLELVGLTVENLRGFRLARLSLERPVTLLVGPNNAGKTSLLRLLEWSISGVDKQLLTGERLRSPEEDELLLPARKSLSRARRLTLEILVRDGRRHKKFHTREGKANLRLRIVRDGVYAAVSPPTRSEPLESEQAAVDLWSELHERVVSLHVPAARDASSDRFRQTLTAAVRASLDKGGIHEVRGGAPSEYRALKAATEQIAGVGRDLLGPLWDALSEELPSGFVNAGKFDFEMSPSALVEWLVSCVDFRISTGDHDSETVKPAQVGSGLQSLLDLALLEATGGDRHKRVLLLEEPEAFLHPAAQRQLARRLLAEGPVGRVVSTHSPIVVDESSYGQVVLVRDHQVYEPSAINSRQEINSALMGGRAAEALFSESVLLVEGPGDWGFFNQLRRRLQAIDTAGNTSKLGLVSVGGKDRFAPWIRLFESYADRQGGLPIAWLIVADSVDAASAVRTAFTHASVTIAKDVHDQMRRIQADYGTSHDRGIVATTELNDLAQRFDVRLHLLPVDLEFSMLSDTKKDTRARISGLLGRPATTKEGLQACLGSKFGGGSVSNPKKDVWIREEIGRDLPRSEISRSIRQVLRRWLAGAMPDDEAQQLLGKAW